MSRGIVSALVCTAVLVAAGCGGSAHPLGTVVTAAAKTSKGSVWWDLSLADAPLYGARVAVPGRGAGAFTRGIAYLAVNIPAVDAVHPSGVEYILFTPTVVYLRPVQAAVERLPAGRELIAAPLSSSVDRWLPGLVGQVQTLNPKLLLEEIASGADSASSHGVEVVDHLPLSKYTVEVSLARAHARATGAQRLAIADEQAALGAAARSLPITIWIDAEGRVARIRATPPGLGTATFALTSYREINVFARAMNIRFGTNTAPTLPDGSQAVDVRALQHPRASPLAGFGAG